MSLSLNSSETHRLLESLAGGEPAALDLLLAQHRGFLRRVLEARMEPQLRQRVDPSDVIQETLLVVSRRIDDYLSRQPTSFKLWIRRKTLEQLVSLRRRHLAHRRTSTRDVPMSDFSSLAVASHLLARRPSELLMRKELAEQVRQVMSKIEESDREILTLRHAEDLSNAEVAEILEIAPNTASKRYGRALLRLSGKLSELGISGLWDRKG